MYKMSNTVLTLAAAGAIVAASGLLLSGTAGAGGQSAKAILHDAAGAEVGTVKFSNDDGRTEVKVHLASGTGAMNAFHGFHIHANSAGAGCLADPAMASNTWFTSVGGHWNPTATTHGAHVGDMPSAFVNTDGSVEASFTIDRIPVGDLAGKAVVLHAGRDNFGNVPVGGAANQYTANSTDATTATAYTGNAGDRIACGVIKD